MKDEMKTLSKDDRDLRLRTKEFAIRVIRMYSTLPKSNEAQVLGKQVLRSGTSVGANYREACRARSKAEFVAKLGDCLKELDETSYWFELWWRAEQRRPKASNLCRRSAMNCWQSSPHHDRNKM